MDHILNKISENPVVCVRGNNASSQLHKITSSILKADNSTTFCYVCEESKKKIISYFYKDKFKVISHQEAIDCLVENKDIASIIYLDNIEKYTLDNFLVMKLWARCYNSSSKMSSRLVLFSNSQDIIDMPFIMEKNYIDTTSKVDIEYYTANFLGKYKHKLNENLEYIVTKKHQENPIKKQESTYVIYLDSIQECNKLYYSIRNMENAQVLMITKDTEPHIIKRLFPKRNTKIRKIIVTNLTELPFEHVDGTFDSMYTCVCQENSSQNRQMESVLCVQSECNKRAHFGNTGFCVRMCKEDFYDTLHSSNISEIVKYNWYKTFLMLYSNKIKADQIFDRDSNFEKIGKTNQYLLDLDLIYINGNNYNLSAKGNFALNCQGLNVKNSTFLKLWMMKELPPFPGIVASCILENFSYYYAHKKDKFVYLLETCNKYFENSQQLNMDNLKEFCKEHKVFKQSFSILLQNIIQVVMYIKDDYLLELGLYKSKNVYTKCKQLLRKVYYQDLVSVDDKVKKTYKDVNGVENVFNSQILEGDFSYPKKVLVMKRKKVFEKNTYVIVDYISV